jgi:gliding motility-associated-like protein
VFFTDSSTNGPIDKWLWSFGDGKGSNVQNPITTYSDTGYKNVKLIVWNNGCSDTIVKGAYIHVKPPIAAFNQTMNDCTNKLKVTFTDASKGAVTYLWDFGDGNTSTLPSPVHIYAASGVYLVTLSVFNGDCGHSKSRQIAVDDNNGILRVSSSVICRNSNVTFSIDSLNTAIPANYNWYIGTGSLIPTTVANLSNVYTQTGNYPVRVIILYSNGCRDTLTSNDGVKVYGPTASFKPAAQQYCSGNTVNFIDSSITDGTHSITNWNWNYGDGNIVNYTSAPFTHQYNSGNAFGVLLKVTDAFGCSDSIYKANAVIVSKSTAAFIETDTLVCPGTTVQFTSQSVGNNLAHQWDLGDGTVSSLVNPSHSYNQGTYTVKLSVVDPLGCSDTLIKINRIQVYNPVAQFLLSDSTAVCPPLLVNMVNNSIHAGTSTWTFGDGSGASLTNPSHMYTYPGNYSVKLVVRNTGGCADSATKHVFINGPTGTLTYMPLTACNPVLVSFSALTQNTVKNIWDFNDGVVNTTTANTTTHTYTLAGHYIPKLILEDATGCRVPIIGKDTIGVKEIKAYIANPYRTICDSASVLFSDSSRTNDIITNYAWKFGDGFYSTQPQPYHVYNTNGLYTVQLHVTTLAGCTDSISYVQAIKVVSSPKATVLGDTVVCKNGSLLFTANRINADTSIVSWHWNFGNGAAANVQNPPAQVYSTAGNFNLVNTITNSSGCFSTITKSIIVHDLPNLNAGIDTAICRNQSYNLSATGAASYTWSGNTSTLSCTTCANPIAKPLTTITYALTGRNAFNCIATDSVTITVQQPLKLTVVKADTICLGSTATIKASGTEKYTWYPTLYIDNPNKAEVNIHPAKDTLMNYMLVGKDNRNCFSDTNYVKVKAYPIPKMEINQAEITINAGSSIKLQTTNSGDVTKWKWTPNKYLDNANSAEPTMIAKESITYVCVAANDGNCVTRDEVKIVVVCNSGNIFVPNTFSPNGDGNNDVFYPRGKGVYTIKNLRIFNRWGETVFERSNFQANDVNSGWDGTYKGVKLASDAYVYSLEIMCDNNTIVPSKGSITLIR